MIKANELRLGNWIYNGIREPFQTNGETINNFDVGQAILGLFTPIPLTEEWLVKFGCETRRTNSGHAYLSFEKINPKTDYGSGFELYEDGLFLCDCDGGRIGNKIEYVHQLQNLYFALTGEELTISNEQ